MTDLQSLLSRLEAAERAATAAPWTWEPAYKVGADSVGPTVYSGRDKGHGLNLLGRLDPDWHYRNDKDLDTLCALRNAAPLLLKLARLVVEAVQQNIVIHSHGCPSGKYGPKVNECSCGVSDWLARYDAITKEATDAR